MEDNKNQSSILMTTAGLTAGLMLTYCLLNSFFDGNYMAAIAYANAIVFFLGYVYILRKYRKVQQLSDYIEQIENCKKVLENIRKDVENVKRDLNEFNKRK